MSVIAAVMKNRGIFYEFLKHWENFKNFLHKVSCQAWVIWREISQHSSFDGFTVKQASLTEARTTD